MRVRPTSNKCELPGKQLVVHLFLLHKTTLWAHGFGVPVQSAEAGQVPAHERAHVH